MMRRFCCFVTVFVLLLSFAACKDNSGEQGVETSTAGEVLSSENTADTTVAETTEENTSEAVTEAESTTAEVQTSEIVTEAVTQAQTTEAVSQEAIVTEADTTESSEDISAWSTEKIVEFYKNAAEQTGTSVQSEQTVGLQDISVNNGQLGGVFSFVTPILSSFLSSSTTVTDGITGDYKLLTAGDVYSAKAYESASGTVVEITLNPQTDKADADRSGGSVAHGISVVGDLLSIMGQLKEKGLPIDISVENTVISYSEPVIKAVVGKDGKIINGTWSCTVEISLSDYKFAGSAVDSTVVVLDNKITVNGGFNP